MFYLNPNWTHFDKYTQLQTNLAFARDPPRTQLNLSFVKFMVPYYALIAYNQKSTQAISNRFRLTHSVGVDFIVITTDEMSLSLNFDELTNVTIRKVRFLKATTECPRSTETLSSVDVDQTDNAPSIYSASQLSIKPRQRESALLKVRQRPRSMQRVAAYTKTRPRASALDQTVVRTQPLPPDFPCLDLGTLAVSKPSCFLLVAWQLG
ncbi:hypothetical protein CSKR_102365 [Clonorchis sinensis]|uniref:Uncharacterized protein n=1 Tax=Clonorchis sinensis TaxID=79923 RepID=A0A419PUT9_CLOSI|nr:hypothetical protein CSKR_102365 [Clonorchis sinensis]